MTTYLPVVFAYNNMIESFQLSDDKTHYIYTIPYKWNYPTDVVASMDFRLDELQSGSTYILGKTTNGRIGRGVYLGMDEGICIHYDGANENSKLWGNFAILKGPWIDERIDDYRNCRGPMKRTDSGVSYNMFGYPDVKFWHKHSIKGPYLVSGSLYNPWIPQDDVAYQQHIRMETLLALQDIDTTLLDDIEKAAITRQIATLQA